MQILWKRSQQIENHICLALSLLSHTEKPKKTKKKKLKQRSTRNAVTASQSKCETSSIATPLGASSKSKSKARPKPRLTIIKRQAASICPTRNWHWQLAIATGNRTHPHCSSLFDACRLCVGVCVFLCLCVGVEDLIHMRGSLNVRSNFSVANIKSSCSCPKDNFPFYSGKYFKTKITKWLILLKQTD